MVESMDGPVSSSSTSRPMERSSSVTRSATPRSSPGGLGIAASWKEIEDAGGRSYDGRGPATMKPRDPHSVFQPAS